MESVSINDGDGLDDLMELETGFYDEGYRTGLEDGVQAGLIEGTLFGIEKGYDKALEAGRLRGRAMVWSSRLSDHSRSNGVHETVCKDSHDMAEVVKTLSVFKDSARLRKQVEALTNLMDVKALDMTNSDEAVAAFDDLMVRARNKAKVVSNITGEALTVPAIGSANTSIEDAHGLTARH